MKCIMTDNNKVVKTQKDRNKILPWSVQDLKRILIDIDYDELEDLHTDRPYTVEPQWFEHLWDHGNLFETLIVRATEGNHGTSSGSK